MKETTAQEIMRYFEGSSLDQVTKNNGVKLMGLAVPCGDTNVKKVIYIDDQLRRIEEGELSLEEAVGEIMRLIANTPELDSSIMDGVNGILNKELILGNVRRCLVNTAMNEGDLAVHTHKDFLDLSVVYRVVLGGGASFKVTNALMAVHGITLEELDEAAERNGSRMASCKSLGEILAELSPSFPPTYGDDFLKVLTYRDRMFGASLMLDKAVLAQEADNAGSDLIILPSSIHEVIMVPEKEMADIIALKNMVSMINGTEVNPEEVLSDQVYRYDRATGDIMIAVA